MCQRWSVEKNDSRDLMKKKATVVSLGLVLDARRVLAFGGGRFLVL